MYRFILATCGLVVVLLVAVIGLSYSPADVECTIANESECTTLDPHLLRWVHENRVARALFEGLTAPDPKTFVPGPGAATHWDISPDGLTYTFHIRPDARWSNGDRVTSDDFYWSWERALNPRIGAEYSNMAFPIRNAKAYYDSISAHDENPTKPILPFAEVGVRTDGPDKLIVELADPCTYFLEITAHAILWPVHRPTYESLGAYTWPVDATGSPDRPYDAGRDAFTRRHVAARPGTMISNGAYTLVEWEFKKRMIIQQNPHYWDRDRVPLERIQILPIEESNTSFMAYETGVVEWMWKPPLRVMKLLYKEWQGGRRPDFHPESAYATYFYVFNCKKPPFDDVHVRRAFALAVDKATICREVTGAGEIPAQAYVPPAGRDASAQTGADGQRYYYDSPEGLAYDVDAAIRELQAAGWTRENGVWQRNGEPLPPIEITYNTHEGHKLIAQAVGKMWEEAFGIPVSLRNLEIKVYDEYRKNGDYMVGRYGWYGDYLDPTTFLNMYRTGDGFNDAKWSNARYDKLLSQAAAEPHPGRRFELLQQAETILVEQELPILPLYYYMSASMYRPNLKGLTPNIRGWVLLKAMSVDRSGPA